MKMKEHITDKSTGIRYTLQGDYYLPDLALPEQEQYELGRYARAKLRYMQHRRKALVGQMRSQLTLNSYLHEVDQECEEAFSTISRQLAQAEGVTEKLKADDQMEWVRRMNSIRSRANEIVLAEYVNVG